MIFKQAFRSLIGNPTRTLLSGLAVVLGVAFVVGAFVLGDMVGGAFDEIFDTANQGVDVRVQSLEEDADGLGQPFSSEILTSIQAVDGVRVAEGSLFTDQVVIIGSDGSPVGGQGPPQFGASWTEDEGLNAFVLEEGRAPAAPNEVVIDVDAADTGKLGVGDRVGIAPDGPAESFEIVGLVSFGDGLGGATFALFTLERAEELFDNKGQLTAITAAAEQGVDQEVLRDRVSAVLTPDVEAITGEQAASDDAADIQEGVSILRNVVLGFGAVALLVSTFVIFNVFSITVAQRTRQLGLLRAVGASGAQVRRMVIVEALVVGVVASLVGIGAGVLLALGLLEFFRLVDIDLPTTSPELLPRTIIWGLAVGIIVTLLAAFVPALRASRVSPVSAMRESTSEEARVPPRVRITAVLLPTLGILLLAWGLWGSLELTPRLTIMGFGALLLFIGAAALTALIARPAVAVIGYPARRLSGVSGKLASENVVRKPGRTASAAAALTIGVALVAFAAVFAFSLRASFDDLLERQFKTDFIAFVDGGDENPAFTPEFADRIQALPEIGVVSRWRSGDFSEPDSLNTTSELFGVQPAVLEEIYDPELLEGSIKGLQPDEVLIQSSAADDRGLSLGDTFTMVFEETGAQPFSVAGIFDDTTFANYMISLEAHDANFGLDADNFVLARVADGVDADAAETAFDQVAADFPQLTAQSNQEFRDEAAADINQLLNVINGMLFMAILIAILGIIATLFLAVYERTREIGLLRAVGMSRRQVFGMVTWESVMTALLGAGIGVILGVIMGVLIIRRLSDDFPILDIPYTLIAVYLVAAAIVGVIAAISPAIIAARMNILKAIQTE